MFQVKQTCLRFAAICGNGVFVIRRRQVLLHVAQGTRVVEVRCIEHLRLVHVVVKETFRA